jgi:hypothetical protein
MGCAPGGRKAELISENSISTGSPKKVVTHDTDRAEYLAVSDRFSAGVTETWPSHCLANCDSGVTERTFDATQG